MVAIRSVPHQTGLRFTFGVKCYGLKDRPGWGVFRVAGLFWTLPPNTLKYLTVEQISQFNKLADYNQRSSFRDVVHCNELRKTKDATGKGIYWTGAKAFQVSDHALPCKVTEVVGEVNGNKYCGIHVVFPDDPNQDYLLITDKDVTMATFYKYLLFYTRHITFHPLGVDKPYLRNFPYSRFRRETVCSIENFSAIPVSCATVQ